MCVCVCMCVCECMCVCDCVCARGLEELQDLTAMSGTTLGHSYQEVCLCVAGVGVGGMQTELPA